MRSVLGLKTAEDSNAFAIRLPEAQKAQPKSISPPAGYGQLPIDVLEDSKEILVIAPIAGVDVDQTEILINDDVLTLQGKRQMHEELEVSKGKNYFAQECYWGSFSRSIILPADAESQSIEAFEKSKQLAADPTLNQFIDRKIEELSN